MSSKKNNTQIIKEMVEAYNSLSPSMTDHPIFIKPKTSEVVRSTVVINKEWEKISDRRIDLIILLDNPGTTEKKEELYLSPNGEAGKQGREFISNYCMIEKKRGQILILNKTPYWSNKSETLQDNDHVKSSVQITFKAIEQFWTNNKNLNVLVMGLNDKTIMNKYFFDFYKSNSNKDFKSHFFFVKHPSFGHLSNQFAFALVSELRTKRKIKMINIFKQFNKLNNDSINKALGK